MDDFEEKLNAILSSPETMARVMSIAQSLGIGSNTAEDIPCTKQEEDTPRSSPSLDPSLLTRLLPLFQGVEGNTPDPHRQLLCALEPFLQEERREKLRKALRTAHFISVGKTIMSSMGDEHV